MVPVMRPVEESINRPVGRPVAEYVIGNASGSLKAFDASIGGKACESFRTTDAITPFVNGGTFLTVHWNISEVAAPLSSVAVTTTL